MTANEKVEVLTQYLPRVADISDRKTAEAVFQSSSLLPIQSS